MGDGISDCLLFGDGFCLSLPMMAARPPFRSVVAPNNGPSKPGFFSCTFTGKVGVTWASTTLDAVGIIPGGGNVLHGIQLGAGIVGAGISVFGNATGACHLQLGIAWDRLGPRLQCRIPGVSE